MEIEHEEETCDACGKNMTYTDENGSKATRIGMCWKYTDDVDFAFAQQQMGDYMIGKTYNICWECCLKGFNVKP